MKERICLYLGPGLGALVILFVDLESVAIKIHPLLLMVPGTLACSFAFMLPVAKPPNAIIFGTERVRIFDMARVGMELNLAGVVTVTVAIFLLGIPVLGVEDFPEWATLK